MTAFREAILPPYLIGFHLAVAPLYPNNADGIPVRSNLHVAASAAGNVGIGVSAKVYPRYQEVPNKHLIVPLTIGKRSEFSMEVQPQHDWRCNTAA